MSLSNPNEPGSTERANTKAEGGGESPPRTLYRFQYGHGWKITSAGYASHADAESEIEALRRMGFQDFSAIEPYKVPATPNLVAELRKWSKCQSAVGMMDLSRILAEAAMEIEGFQKFLGVQSASQVQTNISGLLENMTLASSAVAIASPIAEWAGLRLPPHEVTSTLEGKK